jgi:hypothetical protein
MSKKKRRTQTSNADAGLILPFQNGDGLILETNDEGTISQ